MKTRWPWISMLVSLILVLNPYGFEIIEAQHDMPAYIVAQHLVPNTAFAEQHQGMLASGVLFRKTGPSTVDWPVDPRQISDDRYPVF